MVRYLKEVLRMLCVLLLVFRIATGMTCSQCRNDVGFQGRPGCYHCMQSMEALIKRNPPSPSLEDILNSVRIQEQTKPILTTLEKQDLLSSILRVLQEQSLDYMSQS